MPLFRNEHHVQLDHILRYVSQPQPRQEALQLCGAKIVAQPHLVLGDLLPNRNVGVRDVPVRQEIAEHQMRLCYNLGSAQLKGFLTGLRLRHIPEDVVELDVMLVSKQRHVCLLYTSDAADERSSVDLGGRRIIKKKNQRTS